MIVKNPTKNALSIQYKGGTYSVEAQSSVDGVPSDVATFWKEQIHNFIEVSAERDFSPTPPTEVVVEVVESKEESPVKAEEPKKKVFKK